jgi:hypothetical protein
MSADGESASLERICPTASGELAENWAGSPLPAEPKPVGTPGKANAANSASLPPVISLSEAPAIVEPNKPLEVLADVKGNEPREVILAYRALKTEADGVETSVPMERRADGRFVANIPGQTSGTLLRYRVKATSRDGATRLHPAEHDLRPTFSTYVHDRWEPAPLSLAVLILGGEDRAAARQQEGRGGPGFGPPPGRPPGGPPGAPPPPPPPPGEGRPGGPPRGGFGFFFGRGAEEKPRPPRGASAFIHVDRKTGKVELFDHVNAVSRGRRPGFKLFFQKDRPFNGQTAVSVIFEGEEKALLAEALAYEVYHRAGQPAPVAEFVRLWVDGKPVGYHLLVERPNKSFLRRNKRDDNGNLYKAIWWGQGVAGTHEKKTNTKTGHEDLLAIVDLLEKSKADPDQQWAVIQQHFDVDEMAGYFALNIVLAHWDGFFNNYYTHHDAKDGKWRMYPWDQDRTWGDGMFGDRPLLDLPLTFGMEGAEPPGRRGGGGFGFFGGGGTPWWRPGGVFSRPMLANPHFRKIFLTRIRAIVRDVFTEEAMLPLIDDLANRLAADAALRAQLRGEDPESGRQLLARNVDFLKAFLRGRREYLLKQEELRE